MPLRIEVPTEESAEFCRRHRIVRLRAFGSVLRDDFTPESDVDLIVEFEPETPVGFFELFDMQEQLSRPLGAHAVDLNTPMMLSKYFRDRVLTRAEVLYDGG